MTNKQCTRCSFEEAIEPLKKSEQKNTYVEHYKQCGYNITVTYKILSEVEIKSKRAAITKILVEHVLRRHGQKRLK